MCEKLIHK